jgi:rfaE bifunctional protein kinase chain/domain
MAKKVAISEIKAKILKNLQLLEGKKVLVVGDICLDEYVLGQVRRISPEAPVPLLEVEEEDSRLGMSGNVAQNITSLGGIPYLVSVVGNDVSAETLKKFLNKKGVASDYLVVDANRPTTRKIRIMTQHHHLVRVDYEMKHFLDDEVEKSLINKVASVIKEIDMVIIEDYGKGVISRRVVEKLVQIAHENKKMVLVDPHRTNPGDFYYGVDLLKPNFEESLALAGISYEDYKIHKKNISEVGSLLRDKVKSKYVILTQGKEGMSIFSDQEVMQVPTFARQVFDVTGAGDTVIAALALGLSSGFSIDEACVLANFAAGVVVGKVGCVPCEVEELREYMVSHNLGPAS